MDWKIATIVLAFLFLGEVLFTFMVYTELHDRLTSKSQWYEDNFIQKCPANTEQRCITSNQKISECTREQYELCYSRGVESAAKCSDSSGTSAKCVGNNYIVCDSGYIPVCLDKDKYGVFDGTYFFTCPIGTIANCFEKKL